MRQAEDLRKDLIARAENRLAVKIGVAPMIGNMIFYPLINDMQNQLPDIILDVKEAGSLEIRRWLDCGTIDLGLCLLDCMDLSKFSYVKLNDLELKLCVHKSHPLALKKSVSFQELSKHQLCLLGEDSYQNTLIKKKFEQAGAKPNVLMYSSQLSSLLTLLSHGGCAGFMLEGYVGEDFVLVSMDDPIMLQIGLVWNGKLPEYSHVNRVRRYLKRALKK